MPTSHENPIKKGEYLPTLEEIIASKKPNGVPKEATWIWSPDDELGRLNLLTPDHIKNVIISKPKHGLVCSSNWDVSLPKEPGFGRKACEHTIIPFSEVVVNDEVLSMNTQSGSQLDGFRHVAHQGCQTFYNNLKQEEILGPSKSNRCGMQAISKHGIVGRGVLDFESWADLNAWEGVEFKFGDILFVRSSWMRKYNVCLEGNIEEQLQRVSSQHPDAIGVDQSDEMKTWLHDQYFTLVGGDQPAFEAWPGRTTPILHEYLLACWGVMIGEMLDLEDLSEKCGVATLANAFCII
ncbi:Putative cyclase [Penicillium occitanis (nom. inval.)]|nr:Putative cyclase [Penicillium occitanis (nom. inval.)]PCH01648.1 hypothetical protein PENOC_047050 [Penicillium occitanis (nom. inval.)]